MNQMVAMVTEKKRSLSISTFTSTAVKMKSNRMKTRLPAMRTASDILGCTAKKKVSNPRPGGPQWVHYIILCGPLKQIQCLHEHNRLQ